MVTHPSDPSEHAKHYIFCHVMQAGSLNSVDLNFVTSCDFATSISDVIYIVGLSPMQYFILYVE